MFDKTTNKRIRKTFTSQAAAKTWRQDAIVLLRSGKLLEAKPNVTLREACEVWADEARSGVATTRSGDRYKPAAIRSYTQSLKHRVHPKLGEEPFYAIRRVDLQLLVDELVAAGHAPSTIMGSITALRVVYRRALLRGEIDVLPTQGIKLPSVRTRRERFAEPSEAKQLIDAAPEKDRAIWATAFYAGLRRGELMGLRWEDVDLDAGTLHVKWGWDPEHGRQETKNRSRRRVPIPGDLREHLLAHRLRQKPGIDLVFGVTSHKPFTSQRLAERANAAWKAAGLTRITLHECRHSYASFAIAAGVNAKALCDYMGHSSITVTYDRYGHLMPGNEAQAAELLDAYFAA